MTFLNSAFLFALAAISIPLIIHFISKRRIKIIEFSSLRFLENVQKNRMKWLKIKEIILLLLRMLIIALIVMAFARPTFEGFTGSSGASSSAVIILDRSASMDIESDTGTLLEESKRLILKMIDVFESTDLVTIISFPLDNEKIIIGPSNPGDLIKEKVAEIQQSYSSGDIGESLIMALNVLNDSPDFNREIYIISDNHENIWSDIPPEIYDQAKWEDIHLFSLEKDNIGSDNIGITEIDLPNQLLIPGENFTLRAEITNFGKGRIDNVLAGVIIDGERKAQSVLTLDPGQPTLAEFNVKLESPGFHGGYVEIDYDRFNLDNTKYFSLFLPGFINVLAVGENARNLELLKLIYGSNDASFVEYKGIGIKDFLREDLNKFDVIILSDISALNPSQVSLLRRFTDGGGKLFISLGRNSNTSFWQDFLLSNFEINIGDLSGKDEEYIVWNGFSFEHPIFSVYTSDSDDLLKPRVPDININYYRNIEGGITLGQNEAGIRLMVESFNQQAILYSSGFDLESGELPAHSFFIPLMMRVVEYLGSSTDESDYYGLIGKSYIKKLKRNYTDGLISESEDKVIRNLTVNNTPSGANLTYTEIGRPGLYRLKSGNDLIGILAFNIDKSESSSGIVTADDISALLNIDVNAISHDADIEEVITESRFGREFWKELLILALILLIAESIIARTSPPMAEPGK